ncbi:hypothetical protein ACQ4WX_09900 [Streptomyces lasalocidi]
MRRRAQLGQEVHRGVGVRRVPAGELAERLGEGEQDLAVPLGPQPPP